MGLKVYLGKEYKNKDLGKLKYFLGIEVDRTQKGIVISQRKYTLDLLEEIGKLGEKPIDKPVEQNHCLHSESGEVLHDQKAYDKGADGPDFMEHMLDQTLDYLSQFHRSNDLFIHLNEAHPRISAPI